MPISAVAGKSVTTLEGLGSAEQPHPLQSAFIDEQALQCGYCTSGIIVTAAALLKRNATPTSDEIKQALRGHLCRCGAQPRMIKAVARAAANSSGDDS
jgi:nicotinate dehydrogenase subunit A